MLRCPKCGTDNLLTAVFCRGCGDKLDLNAIKPDDMAAMAPKNSNAKQNIIGGIIIAVLVVVAFVGTYFPGMGTIDATAEQQEAAVKKYSAIKSNASDSFTDEEVTAYISKLVADAKNEKPLRFITVRLLDENKVKAIVGIKVFGIPASLTVVGDVKVADSKIDFTHTSKKIGLFPVFSFLQQHFDDAQGVISSAVSKANNRIKDCKISEGKLELTKGKQPRPGKKAKAAPKK